MYKCLLHLEFTSLAHIFATSFLYSENEEPKFSQVHILDKEQAMLEPNGQTIRYQLYADVLWARHQVFLSINLYVKSFRMMHEVASDGSPNIKMYFKH